MAEMRVNEMRLERGHPIFAGHFPNRPIVPGVMLLDWAMREAATALACGTFDLTVRECKFLEPLEPERSATLYFEASAARVSFRIRASESDRVLATGIIERHG